jgi:hypothetical protein
MELTPASSHSPPQWWGWAPPREFAKQRWGVIPRRVVAWLCCVRALNARTRAGAGAVVRESRARRSPARGRRGPSSEVEPARGGVSPRARRTSFEGGLSSRARRTSFEGGVSPRARRTCSRGYLAGPLWWAAGVTAAWAALRVCALRFAFLRVLSRIPPGFLGDPQGCLRQ